MPSAGKLASSHHPLPEKSYPTPQPKIDQIHRQPPRRRGGARGARPAFFSRSRRARHAGDLRADEDGAEVDVLNKTWSKGKRDYTEGTAYKADEASDEAKLKVKSYVPPFLPIISVFNDYWVLYVDADYQYAKDPLWLDFP